MDGFCSLVMVIWEHFVQQRCFVVLRTWRTSPFHSHPDLELPPSSLMIVHCLGDSLEVPPDLIIFQSLEGRPGSYSLSMCASLPYLFNIYQIEFLAQDWDM